MDQITDILKPWLDWGLDFMPGDGQIEQLWFSVMALGAVLGLFLIFSAFKIISYIIKTPKRRKMKREAMAQNAAIQQALAHFSNSEVVGASGESALFNAPNALMSTSPQQNEIARKPIAKVQIFIDYANFDKNWVDNAYGLLAEGNQKVRLDWNKLTDVVMREVAAAVSSWQPELAYRGTFVQASVLPERFTTPRAYKLPKTIAANYYIYAKDAELVRSKLDGKEYIAKKLHPAHNFLKYMMRKLPGYQVNISRRVIARNHDGSPVVMTSKSGIQYIKSGEKAVDSKVIADMTAGAMSEGYDIAVLLGSDTDFLPVIDTIQKGFNKPVIHFGFERGGHQVRSACWSHVVLDKRLVSELREPPKIIPTSHVISEPTAVSAVAAKLASPETQESVKQVVQLFTPEGSKPAKTVEPETVAPAITQDIAPVVEKTVFEAALSTKVEAQ